MCSITIIGAGPAGCIAAILLSRANFDVTMIEQHRFPRDKVCGECISAVGIDVLYRTSLIDTVYALTPVILTHSLIHAADGSVARIDLPSKMLGLSRLAFDLLLLDSARNAGATIRQPARCELQNGSLMVRDLTTNRVAPIGSDFVLLADGKGALVANTTAPTSDLGIKSRWIKVDCSPDAISLFGVDGHYGGIAPVESDRWNVAFSVPRDRIAAAGGDIDAMFGRIANENAALRNALKHATRVSPWLTSPLPRFGVESRWPAGMIPLGNAAAAVEPIGGEGMGLAMRSAEIAAEEIIAARDQHRAIDVELIRSRFDKLWRVRRAACRAGALVASHPAIASIAARIVDDSPFLKSISLALTGKSAK